MKHVVAVLVVVLVAVECMPSALKPFSMNIPSKKGEKNIEIGFSKSDGLELKKTSTEVQQQHSKTQETSESTYESDQENGDQSSSVRATSKDEKNHEEQTTVTKKKTETLHLGGTKGVQATKENEERTSTYKKDHESGNQSTVRKDRDGANTHDTVDESEYARDSESHDETTKVQKSQMGLFGNGKKSMVEKDEKITNKHEAVSSESGSSRHMESGHTETQDGQTQDYIHESGSKHSKTNAESSTSESQKHQVKEYDDDEQAKKGHISRIPAEVVKEMNKNSRRLGLYGGNTQIYTSDSVENIQDYPGFAGLRNDYLLALAKKIYGTKFVNIGGDPRIVDSSSRKSHSNSRSSHLQVQKHLPVSSQYYNTKVIESRFKNIPHLYVPGAKYNRSRYGNDTHTRLGTVRKYKYTGSVQSGTENTQDEVGNIQDETGKSEDAEHVNNTHDFGRLQINQNNRDRYVNDGSHTFKRKPTIAPDVRNAILSQKVGDLIKKLDLSQDAKTGLKSGGLSEIGKNHNIFRRIDFNEILMKSREAEVNNKNKNKDVKKEHSRENTVNFNGLEKYEDVSDVSNSDDQQESITETKTIKNKQPASSHEGGINNLGIKNSNDESVNDVSTERIDTDFTNDNYRNADSNDNKDKLPLSKYGDTIVRPDAYRNTKDNDDSTADIVSDVGVSNRESKNFSITDIDSNLNSHPTNSNEQTVDDSVTDSELGINNNISPSPHIEKIDSTRFQGSIDEIDTSKTNNIDNSAESNESNNKFISHKIVNNSDSTLNKYDNVTDKTNLSSTSSTADKDNSISRDIYDNSQSNASNSKETNVEENMSKPVIGNVNNFIFLDNTSPNNTNGETDTNNLNITDTNADTTDTDGDEVTKSKIFETKSSNLGDNDDYSSDLSVIGLEKSSIARAFTTEKIINSDNITATANSDDNSHISNAPSVSPTSDVSTSNSDTQIDLTSDDKASETADVSNLTDIAGLPLSDIYSKDKSVDTSTIKTNIATLSSADDLTSTDSSIKDRLSNSTDFTTPAPETLSEVNTFNATVADMNTEKTIATASTSTISNDSTIALSDNKSDATSTTVTEETSSSKVGNELNTVSVTPATTDTNIFSKEITSESTTVDNNPLVKSDNNDTTNKVIEDSSLSTSLTEIENLRIPETADKNSNTDVNTDIVALDTNTSDMSERKPDKSNIIEDITSKSSLPETSTSNTASEAGDKNNSTDIMMTSNIGPQDTTDISESKSDDRLKVNEDSISSSIEAASSNTTSETADKSRNLNLTTSNIVSPVTNTTDISLNKSDDSLGQINDDLITKTSFTGADTSNSTSETINKINDTFMASDIITLDNNASNILESKFDDSLSTIDKNLFTDASSTETGTSNTTSETADKISNTNMTSDIIILDNNASNRPENKSNDSSNTINDNLISSSTEVSTSNTTSEIAKKNRNTDITEDIVTVDNISNVIVRKSEDSLSKINDDEITSTTALTQTGASNTTSETADKIDKTSNIPENKQDASLSSEGSVPSTSLTESSTSNSTSEAADKNNNTDVNSDLKPLDFNNTSDIFGSKQDDSSNEVKEGSISNTPLSGTEMPNTNTNTDATSVTPRVDTAKSTASNIKSDYFFSRVTDAPSSSIVLSEPESTNITSLVTDTTSNTATPNNEKSDLTESKSEDLPSEINDNSSSSTPLSEAVTSNITSKIADANNTVVTSDISEADTDTLAISESKPNYFFSRFTEEPSSSTATTEVDTSNILSETKGKNADVTSVVTKSEAGAISDYKPKYYFSKVIDEPNSRTIKTDADNSNNNSDAAENNTDVTSNITEQDGFSNVSEESGATSILAALTATPDKSANVDITTETPVVKNESSNLIIDAADNTDDSTNKIIEEPNSNATAVETANTVSDITSNTAAVDNNSINQAAVHNSKADDTSSKETVDSTSVINSGGNNVNHDTGTPDSKDTAVNGSVSTSDSTTDGNVGNSTTAYGAGDKHNVSKPVKPVIMVAEESRSDESLSRSASGEPTILAGLDLINQSAYESGSASFESLMIR